MNPSPPPNPIIKTQLCEPYVMNLEIRLFYVRVFPCASAAAPPFLALSHLPDRGTDLEINGARIPASKPTTIRLRRNRTDRDAAGVTYISTDCVRLTGAVYFDVSDDRGNLILCVSLDWTDAPRSNRAIGFDHHQLPSSVRDPKTGWNMDCYFAASIGSSIFPQPPKSGFQSSPSIEVYVAGCFAGVPLILTQIIQLSPILGSVRLGTLDAIPEEEEATDGDPAKNDGFEPHEISLSLTIVQCLINLKPLQAAENETDEYSPTMAAKHNYNPEGWYSEDDGQLWFKAGFLDGLGIGLGMCVGIGIGVGLLLNSYQATARSFRRRFF
ncbi:hypothetical protein ZIOFF_057541 [Zingiber officinale]|uniref:Uncharacterized protein n=1 Tax=Zingiber officinale TaxID=94328 RepID=A0A8J5F8H0_ZINOF|nr:hypothetical protein ZIOFF_057541 [Zingiber officinale]